MFVEIKKLQEQHVPQVLNLCREIREYHRKILDGYFIIQDDELERNQLLNFIKIENSIALIAVDRDKIVGLLLAEQKISPWLENPKTAHISNFGVCEKYRGNGIGKSLMNFFYNVCEENGIKEIKLGVFNKNEKAYRFYHEYGFEPQEQRMSLKVK